jgi:hypothetical protein
MKIIFVFIIAFFPINAIINVAITGSDDISCKISTCRTLNFSISNFHPLDLIGETYQLDQGLFSENVLEILSFFFRFFIIL